LFAQGHRNSDAQSSSSEMEQNRRQLELWRKDKQNYVRLLNELRAFLGLSAEKQRDMRVLDRALAQEKPSRRARLFDAMERYADWLERLPPADRLRIRQASTADDRLRVIREIRLRNWIEHLPRADRERLAKLQGAEREKLLAQLRKRDRQRRKEWAAAMRHWD